MVAAAHILAVLSVLPFSFSIVLLPPDFGLADATSTLQSRSSRFDGSHGRWLPRRPPSRDGRKRGVQAGPHVVVGGTDLEVQARRKHSHLHKRAPGNGSIVHLGTALNTYVVPVMIGDPAVIYPLQLDLGSSDLLIASTLCGDNCPDSLGPNKNPYYDSTKGSTTFQAVNGNSTAWEVGFADQRGASGFVAREKVVLGEASVDGQAFGMINATNLTLAEQQISGILGLGFPRLSVLARALLNHSEVETSDQSSSPSVGASETVSASASAYSASTMSTTRSAYLPPLLESLVTTPHLPYPVFGLALSPPTGNATGTAPAPSASAQARFHTRIGSLTLGGVSGQYISNVTGSGFTVSDIEWHDVIPFGRVSDGRNDTVVTAATATATLAPSSNFTSAESLVSASSSNPTSAANQRKRQETSSLTASDSEAVPSSTPTSHSVPASASELAGEAYLYWAVELRNVSVNGTNVPLNPTYSYLDVPSIALLDAGFNGIIGPFQDVAAIFDDIPDARQSSTGQWVAPCDTKATIGFSFGGRYVHLQPEDWLYAAIQGSSFCLAWPIATYAAGDGIDWQLGTPFLKNIYSVFSYGINGEQAPLVGFLPLQQNVTAASAPANSTAGVPSSSRSYGATATTIVVPFTPTTTVNVDIPNAVLPVPTYSLPSYVYEIDPAITPGVLQNIGLANASAYDVGEVPLVTPANVSTMTSMPPGGVGSVGGSGDANQGEDSSAVALRLTSPLISSLSLAFLVLSAII